MATECMAGGSFEQWLREVALEGWSGILIIDDAVLIAVQMCEGLYYAHKRSIVHRDLKPADVLFNARGDALLADSDSARLAEWSRPGFGSHKEAGPDA